MEFSSPDDFCMFRPDGTHWDDSSQWRVADPLPETADEKPEASALPEGAGKERLITLWRKTGEKLLEWDNYVSEDADEASRVVENLKKQGVLQWSTYRLGVIVPTLSDTTTPKGTDQ